MFKHFSEAAVFVDEHLDFVLYFFAIVEVVAIVIEFLDGLCEFCVDFDEFF